MFTIIILTLQINRFKSVSSMQDITIIGTTTTKINTYQQLEDCSVGYQKQPLYYLKLWNWSDEFKEFMEKVESQNLEIPYHELKIEMKKNFKKKLQKIIKLLAEIQVSFTNAFSDASIELGKEIHFTEFGFERSIKKIETLLYKTRSDVSKISSITNLFTYIKAFDTIMYDTTNIITRLGTLEEFFVQHIVSYTNHISPQLQYKIFNLKKHSGNIMSCLNELRGCIEKYVIKALKTENTLQGGASTCSESMFSSFEEDYEDISTTDKNEEQIYTHREDLKTSTTNLWTRLVNLFNINA